MMICVVLTWFCILGVYSSQEIPSALNIDNYVNPQNSATPKFDTPGVFQVTPPVDHAEGPFWDSKKFVLYFVDIFAGRVLSYNYNTKALHSITLNGAVTVVIPSKKNENILIVGVNRTLVALEWDGEKELGQQKALTSVSPQFPDSRLNDGKADSKGRVWIGTMGNSLPNQGVLYKIEKSQLAHPTVEVAPVSISNGIAWNKDNTKMYYIDSPTHQIVEYDFDVNTGDISNKKVVIDITKFPTLAGVPDGMTIDYDDNLWIALYGGGAVIKANPKTGQLLQVVPIPARDVSSVAWGGSGLEILFVTTSRVALNATERKEYPAAGSVFAITNLETKGRPAYYADLVDSVRRNLLVDLLQSTNELLSPSNNINSNDFQKNNIQKKHTNNENSFPEFNKPLWMTMLERIRGFF